MKRIALVGLLCVLGCSSTDDGRTTRWTSRPMTTNDTPVGGGVAPSQKPNGDPYAKAGSRTVIQPQWGADNGAPETRVGGNGDTRLAR